MASAEGRLVAIVNGRIDDLAGSHAGWQCPAVVLAGIPGATLGEPRSPQPA